MRLDSDGVNGKIVMYHSSRHILYPTFDLNDMFPLFSVTIVFELKETRQRNNNFRY